MLKIQWIHNYDFINTNIHDTNNNETCKMCTSYFEKVCDTHGFQIIIVPWYNNRAIITSILMLFSKRTPSSFIKTKIVPATYAAHLNWNHISIAFIVEHCNYNTGKQKLITLLGWISSKVVFSIVICHWLPPVQKIWDVHVKSWTTIA